MELVRLSRKLTIPTDSLHVSDIEAKKQVMAIIDSFKLEGKQVIDIIDLQRRLHVHVDKINEVMNLLEKEGVVRER